MTYQIKIPRTDMYVSPTSYWGKVRYQELFDIGAVFSLDEDPEYVTITFPSRQACVEFILKRDG